MYTEITLKDQIATLRQVVRETEMKHFLATTQAEANRTQAQKFKDTDKRRVTVLRDQANKDAADAESMLLVLEYVRAKLDKLVASDPENAETDEAEPVEPTKLFKDSA